MSLQDIGTFSCEQPDGAEWSVFYKKNMPDGHHLILTSSGSELLLGHKGIGYAALRQLMSAYEECATTNTEDQFMHDFLGSGQQAVVYGMGKQFAVREQTGTRSMYASLAELSNMDELASLVEAGVPRWINVPHYYMHFCSSSLQKQYTLMDRIDSGMTVEDLVEYPDVPEHAMERVLKEFKREPSDEERDTAMRLFNKAGMILRTVIASRGDDPDFLLRDWRTRNVIVEPLRTPIGNEKYKLTVIDQN